MAYLPCELNCRSTFSNGNLNVVKLQQECDNDHLAFIALADMETSMGYSQIDNSIIPVIKGISWKTEFGEIRALGVDDNIKFDEREINSYINNVKSKGGVIGVAPANVDKIPDIDWKNVDYIDVWQGGFSLDNNNTDNILNFWSGLLDKGYHIACAYGRKWENTILHFGCSYVDVDGEIEDSSILCGISNGRIVASTGAKLFFRVHQKGNTYNLGETIKKGSTVFSFFNDLHSREKNVGTENIEYKTVKLITNGNVCVMESSLFERHIAVNLKKNQWYRAELWGTIDGEPKRMAITSPIYTS